MGKKYICFGEIMLRLMPVGYSRFLQAGSFEATYAGSESNVAVSLSMLGEEAAFVTKVPDNEIGASAVNSLRRYGVDTSRVITGGPRLGTYFCEKGIDHRPGKVIYDRAGSSLALAKPSEFRWKKLLKGFGWYHMSGITPALSSADRAITLASVKTARELGLTVSCDLNYRSALWSREEARAVMQEIVPYCDLIITNIDQADDVLALRPNSSLAAGSDEAYLDLSRKIRDAFGTKLIAYTLRESPSSSHNIISGILYDAAEDRLYRAPKYDLLPIADRIGGGDAFAGALIAALGSGRNARYAVGFAAAAEALKHSVEGDVNLCTKSEIEALMNSGGSIRILR